MCVRAGESLGTRLAVANMMFPVGSAHVVVRGWTG